ncbi:MAG: diguanylate cyclase [Campylobacterota bacterium]|nr:diguanylate cyclase [Campylobacterota bacterium]
MFSILLLDDNEKRIRQFSDSFNQHADIRLYIASSDSILKSFLLEEEFDLILADARCQFLDVLTMIPSVYDHVKLQNIPYLLCSIEKDIQIIEKAYQLGIHEYIVVPTSLNELLLRIRFHIKQSHKLKASLNKNERLASVITTDPLTKISNRMHLQTILRQALKEYPRYKKYFSLIYMRISDMPKINSIFGFTDGDKLLYDTAQFVSATIRKSDIVTRWGGGDFIIFAPNTRARDAQELTKKIDVKIKEKALLSSFNVRYSYGISEVKDGDDINIIFKRVQKALENSMANHMTNYVVI